MRRNRGPLAALLGGALAGAAGTSALNAVTYLDMTLRGRPASQTPAQTVEQLAEDVGVDVPGGPQARQHRLEGLGALTGIGTGVAVGALYGLARAVGPARSVPGWVFGMLLTGVGAMVVTDASMARLGVTRPGDWSTSDWLADAIPHATYGAVTAGCVELVA